MFYCVGRVRASQRYGSLLLPEAGLELARGGGATPFVRGLAGDSKTENFQCYASSPWRNVRVSVSPLQTLIQRERDPLLTRLGGGRLLILAALWMVMSVKIHHPFHSGPSSHAPSPHIGSLKDVTLVETRLCSVRGVLVLSGSVWVRLCLPGQVALYTSPLKCHGVLVLLTRASQRVCRKLGNFETRSFSVGE